MSAVVQQKCRHRFPSGSPVTRRSDETRGEWESAPLKRNMKLNVSRLLDTGFKPIVGE